ncbi:MAG: hypothetical protein O3B24_08840, partial [Verrucomicrobia bacterium]|nr:hypothetical protein [Verrucomicrobiota bacterium]
MTQKTPDHTLTPRQTFSRRRCCRTLLVWIAPLLLIVALHTRGQLLRTELYPHALFLLAAGALALWLWRSRGSATMDFARARPFIPLLIGLVLCLFASVTLHRWFFFLNWAPLTSWSSLSSVVVANRGLSGFVALTLLLTPFLARGLRRPWRPVLAILLLAEALCIAALMLKTSGAALYRIDHPSFMLRLWEFSHQFPQLVNYMPHWNGGVLHQASVITGVAGPGLALWPLFRFFPIENIYTPAWAILFLVIVPWLAVASVRALGGDRTAAFTGGILGLGVSQHFFLWGLHYGTIGASFASAMTMPVCALGFRAIWLRKINIYTALGLILAGTLLLMWPPCGIVALAVALSALCSASRWSRRTLTFLTLCAAAILTLFSPWLLAVLAEGKTEIAFVGQTAAPSDAKFQALLTWAHFCSGADHLAAHLREFNPVLLFLGLLGAALGPSRALRRWFLPILLVLAAVTGWAREFLPHGQLSRMSIPLAFAAVPPAALYLGRLLRTHDVRLAALRAALLALLILSGLSVRAITGNRGLARYATMPEDARGLADWISTNTPPDGRVLFAG